MKKLTLLIISIFFLVIFFGCDKGDIESDNQRNQVDIRDSIVGIYYGSGYGTTVEFHSLDNASTRTWDEDSLKVTIAKDSLNGLIIDCNKLHFVLHFDIHRYPFIEKDNSGNYIYGCGGCVCSHTEYYCTYDPVANSIIFNDLFFCPSGNFRITNTVTINQ